MIEAREWPPLIAIVIAVFALAVSVSNHSRDNDVSLIVERCVDHRLFIYGAEFGKAERRDNTNKPIKC